MFISVILAAGEGTRMKSKHSKVSQKILNRPMISYILKASEKAGVEKNIIIVGKNKTYIEELFSNRALYKEQKIGDDIPYGTGYAVGLASDEIGDEDDVLVLNGDCPLLTGESLRDFLAFHKEGANAGSLMTSLTDNPKDYGRIIRDDEGYLKAIVEEKDASEEEKLIKEINSGVFIFKGGLLKESLTKLDTNNSQGEVYITDVIGILSEQGHQLGIFQLEDEEETYGINSKDQLAEAQEIMRMRVNTYHMKNGVVMENPRNIFIEPGVIIGRDTYIYSGARIEGDTVIGEDCLIQGDTHIKDSAIGDGSTIRSSYLESSVVGSGVDIGPFAQLRPGTVLKDHVHIGNFVEVKNGHMDEGSKAGHHAYIGDARIGRDVNIGCGVIFANYDGKNKHISHIGDRSFIGSNSTIVSPITIKEDAFVAADSTVTKNVEKGSLYLTRPETKIMEEWVYKKRGDKND